MRRFLKFIAVVAFAVAGTSVYAQKYTGVVDKVAGVVGNEMIKISELESQVRTQRVQGYTSDRNIRCEVLEQMLESKIFLMQARVDSLELNQEMVNAELNNRLDQVRTTLGGDAAVEKEFNMPMYKLRQLWRKQLEELSLTQQEQGKIAENIDQITPYDVKQYLDTVDVSSLPMIPTKYQMSQICIYPDREAAAMAVKERLLSIRERIINGERFATLARLYSEDPGSARRGGELGMASKSIFWPAFSDAAMSLKPGLVSQIVETPDGFHIIEVIEKDGDMFNARHILLKPNYTSEDRDKAFARLDSLRNSIVVDSVITFELAAQFFSEDPASRTNGGQMADPNTGSAYFEIDQMKPQDYEAVQNLEIGQISEPIESLDNEGRDGNLVYKIVRLDNIVPSHVAKFETDYTEILAQYQNIKQIEALNKFVDEKIESTYIIIDPLFADCEFSRPGWSKKIAKEEE